MNKPGILVLCTGNSCRSQMAEGFLRAKAGERFEIQSAGTVPKEAVHPLAVEVMREAGIDISQHQPKSVKQFLGRFDVRYLIIVCSTAESECPSSFPNVLHRLFWPFDDPAAFVGEPAATLAEFRRVRDEIETKIDEWLPAA